MNKQKHDVLGASISCPKFNQCPFCYGCRAYSSADLDCIECAKNMKFNICKTHIHTPEILTKTIIPSSVKLLGERIIIESANRKDDKE